MNMHCLVAVARCRVQTRRYHCLINHIQSHRLTLCPSASPFSRALSAFPALVTPLAERTTVSSLGALPRILPHRVIPFRFSPRSSPQSAPPPFPSRQLAAIDINLRNFFGTSTCHRVTAHPQPGVPDADAEYVGMRFAGIMGEGSERKRANEDKRGRGVESPNGHPWSPRGDIRNVNRTNQLGTNWPRNWARV